MDADDTLDLANQAPEPRTGQVETAALSETTTPATLPSRIGPYRILRELGRGGMGAVFLAARDDAHYTSQVAFKLIKGGADSEEVVRRFRLERQILANLQHPNIARLLDGGTTEDSSPYFVMEYIEGEQIHRYCEGRPLSLRDRLALFRHVCGAVQHAHRNLVVHRDLKPGNILVTAEGVPKLRDFGIAKLLDPDAAAGDAPTATAMAMTPDYASPEQARALPITTATDVVAHRRGDLASAESLHREALAIRRRAFPGDHPRTAMSLNNLGNTLEERGALPEAETLAREALGMRRRLFGEEHPDVAMSLHQLGSIRGGDRAGGQARLAEALAMRRRVLGERHARVAETAQRLGPGHPSIAATEGALGECLRRQGRLTEAEPFLVRSVAKKRVAPGS